MKNMQFNKPRLSLLTKIEGRLLERKARRRFEAARLVPLCEPSVLFPGLDQVAATVQAAVPTNASIGNVSPYELILLASICRLRSPNRLFEFGTYDGQTTLHLAINSPASAEISTLDLAPSDPLRTNIDDDTFYTHGVETGSRFQGHQSAKKIRQIFCNSLDFNHDDFRDACDLIFVDAGHAYDLVCSDSRKALEMVASGGLVIWHDYSFSHKGVYRCLNEISEKHHLKQLNGTALVCHFSTK